MATRSGSISVQTSDIFPIIKKWLYSEHDIFLRELVANATDAITKRATLSRGQNLEVPAAQIDVLVDKAQGLLIIKDNGLGMSEAEVEKYIAQLAFSGAEEFVQKMKETSSESGKEIIGKFGLGFYSAFMVASKVTVDSLSYLPGSTPTLWSCEGNTEYTFDKGTRTEAGTTITLTINQEDEHAKEFLQAWKVSETLRNFCDFLPYPIYVVDNERVGKKEGPEDKDSYQPTLINDTKPLWRQDPQTLKDQDYQDFYRKLFPMDQAPLFWLHLKVDHPFTLEGILYFPKINPMKPVQDRAIKLYCKQVFVSDNVKGVIPDFLSLLKGVIDSNDIPLNVSRSALQGDPNVKKISNYIVKKVAEALKKLFNQDRNRFAEIWEDVALFAKYGCISDTKFDELMKEYILFKNSEDKLITLEEYRQSIPEAFKEKLKEKVLYFEKGKSDPTIKKQLLENGLWAIETDDHIDPHFTQHLEIHGLAKTEDGKDTIKVQFTSIDSALSEILTTDATNEEDIRIKELFQKTLGEGRQESDFAVDIAKVQGLNVPAYLKADEQAKRFAKMTAQMGAGMTLPIKQTLMINPYGALIKNILKLHEKGGKEQLVSKLCHHVEGLAAISAHGLEVKEREEFVRRSQELMAELTSALT